MTDIAISVQNLGKRYTIGHQKSGSLRESFSGKVKNLFAPNHIEKEEFWALKDINFEIKKGEAVGIIGRNGAGKSTLLKILSRITDPTTGGFEINGRVSSLLEVGTGFHPELSGRENIYLNGTILGMKRAEIKSKFDEILAFSGVEKFIDTPVKHYSSGMKVRLAFSVAAHLEPEILIVDEVLAVGDAEFQKKCLGKMDEVSKNEGRTVLFVSHNMGAIEGLCSRGVLLKNGKVDLLGEIQNIVHKYINDINNIEQSNNWTKAERNREMPIEIVKILTEVSVLQTGIGLRVEVDLASNTDHALAFIAFNVLSEDGTPIFQSIPSDKGFIEPIVSGQKKIGLINLPPLIPGNYKLSVWVGPHYSETYCWEKEKITFTIEKSPIIGRIQPHSKKNGHLVSESYIVS